MGFGLLFRSLYDICCCLLAGICDILEVLTGQTFIKHCENYSSVVWISDGNEAGRKYHKICVKEVFLNLSNYLIIAELLLGF